MSSVEALVMHLEVAFILSLATSTEDKSPARVRVTLRSTVCERLVAVTPSVAVHGLASP